jgi:hypothetical protein
MDSVGNVLLGHFNECERIRSLDDLFNFRESEKSLTRDSEKSLTSSQVLIRKISDFSLQVIVLLIGWITGSADLHQASRAQMNCAVQCLNAQIFDWSTTLLDCMKRQLTDCRLWNHRNVGFGTILCSFFFERVPSFSPREVVRGPQASLPMLCRWAVLLL